MRKDAAHPSCDEQGVGRRAQGTESNLIFDYIAHQRAIESITRVWDELVPVMPAPKRSFLLRIGEVMVPFKFRNHRGPRTTPGEPAKWTKRSIDDRAHSCEVVESDCVLIGQRWRRDELKTIYFRLSFRRHEARQVLRVREKGEDVGDREGYPVGELHVVWHRRESDAGLGADDV